MLVDLLAQLILPQRPKGLRPEVAAHRRALALAEEQLIKVSVGHHPAHPNSVAGPSRAQPTAPNGYAFKSGMECRGSTCTARPTDAAGCTQINRRPASNYSVGRPKSLLSPGERGLADFSSRGSTSWPVMRLTRPDKPPEARRDRAWSSASAPAWRARPWPDRRPAAWRRAP
jgi:hypothetical protein